MAVHCNLAQQMTPYIVGTFALTAMLGAGVVEQSNLLVGVGGAGVALMQVWTLTMLQPLRDKIARLETRVAVIEARCGAHYGSQYMKTPPPFQDTPT